MKKKCYILLLVIVSLSISLFAEAPKGKTGPDFVAEAKKIVEGITPKDAYELFKEGKAIIYDARSKEEHTKDGFIKGSRFLERGKIEFAALKVLPDANDKILALCKLGGRAALVAVTLKEMGYKDVKYIEGGIMGWRQEKLPVEGLK